MFTEEVRSRVKLTETQFYKNRTSKALFSIICISSMLGLSLLAMYMFYQHDLSLEGYATLTKILLAVLFISGYFFLPYPISTYGFNRNNLDQVLKESIAISLFLLLMSIGFRHFLISIGFEQMRFRLNFRLDILFYPVFAFLQEIITKGFVQSYLYSAFDKYRHNKLFAIISSSLVFALSHLIHGYAVFAGIFFFSMFTGWYYERNRNIWGVTIIHTILGWSLFYFQ